MSVDCYCSEHRNYFECQTMYNGEAHYPVPAIIYDVYMQIDNKTSLQIWERTGTKFEINRRVYAYQA